MDDPVAQARQWYAEELRFTAHVRSWAVVDAFATVPRERFVGPGPWRILSQWDFGAYWTTADADPRHVYHDVLIALDETRRLNTGNPASGPSSMTRSDWTGAPMSSISAPVSATTVRS
jgi:protein-L-isoaspartate(D-aspartate) O-methyltransferase